MLKTTKEASASQNRAMTATTQPTTSFWLAAKITATRKAVIRTSRPGPLMRNRENPPRPGVDEDLELPRDCMQLFSQIPGAARDASTGGEQPPADRPNPAGRRRLGEE